MSLCKKDKGECLRRFYEDICEYHPAEMIVVDEKGKVVFVNAAKRNGNGRTLKIGMVMYQDYASKHDHDMHQELMECIQSGEGKHFPEMVYGENILKITITPINNGAIIVSENITREVKMRRSLEKSEAQLRAVMESAQDSIVVMDCHGNVSFWNASATRLFGYSEEDAIGSPLCDLIVPEADRKKCSILLKTFIDTGEGIAIGRTVEKKAVRKDGSIIDIQTSLSRIKTECGWSSIGIIRDITDSKKAEEELRRSQEFYREQSIRDPLTGLYNRLHFADELPQETARSRRYKQPMSVIMFDVDNFKDFNENFGHAQGDQVLEYIGSVILGAVRENDIPCRIGGEEIFIILPMADLETAIKIAERISVLIKGIPLEFTTDPITVSGGVVQCGADDFELTLYKKVDGLLASAKKNGKDQVVFKEVA